MQDLSQLGEQLEHLISSKTVIGAPIPVGNVTLVPIIKANFGFGMGGGTTEGVKRGGTSGGGGGAVITPVAIVVIKADGDVSLLPVDKIEGNSWLPLMDKLPQVYEKIMAMRKPKAQAEDDSELE